MVLRVLLASVFLLAGAAKFVNPVGTRQALRDFGLPAFLARPMVMLLPLLELGVAAALMPASLAWYAAWGALGLLAAFLIVIGIAMLRGRHPDCNCFGQLHSAPVGRSTLIRNVVFAACAVWVVAQGPGKTGPAVWTWLAGLNSLETKIAAIAGCLLAFLLFRALVSARAKPQPTEDTELALPFSLFGDSEEEETIQAPAPAPRPRPSPNPAPAPQPAAQPQTRSAPAHPLDIGLPIGTPAPEFELPAVTGEKRSLASLREGGRDVLLIFSSPHCKSCEALGANLARWTAGWPGLPNVVVVSRGAPRENMTKLKDFEPSKVLLQNEHEVAHAYDCSSTPTAVLVGADGLIKTQLVTGGLAIRELLRSAVKGNPTAAANTKSAQRASVLGG